MSTYDITPELPVIQEMVDLLNAGKIVYVEMTRKHTPGNTRNEPVHFLFINVDDLASVRCLSEYRDIKILFPEKMPPIDIEKFAMDYNHDILSGKAIDPSKWPIYTKSWSAIMFQMEINELTKTAEQNNNANYRWGRIFWMNTWTNKFVQENTIQRCDDDFFVFHVKDGIWYWTIFIYWQKKQEMFTNGQALSDWIINNFFYI